MTSPRHSSFPPVIGPDTRVLILGSLPGAKSLERGRYYAHPQNRFWQLVGRVIDEDLPAMAYETRLETLLGHRVGLWDTIASAMREGSLDAAIRKAEHNPLADLVATLPDLTCVAFNGAAAARIGGRLLDASDPKLIALPSSSPAYAAMPLSEKQDRWMALRDYL
ncbi:DNA-deoxyinosine glycosylase [Aurantiacibacter spongiae]|uniref:DNA-deoxyinosine glycosylase n=1 Tax=Aurantiacibacter spongiae TaxID=2488860 RepID=A0A3N5DBH3_9SPHN|nr:DNA-deoxyinosine glycosylase [Aurantiacibacter spongiae]RPF72108.1 DNA-deoxyinosine glycosylase [Aurantiacibacter spongiae]